MNTFASSLVPALLLAGCVVPAVDDGAPLPASGDGAAAVPVTLYDCQGRTVQVRSGEAAAELTVDGRTDSLPRVAAASGAKYELGQDEAYRLFWAKGDTARIALGDAEWLACDVAVTDGTPASAAKRSRPEVFQARGVEPSWSLAMLDGSIVFERADGSEGVMAVLQDTVELPNGGARHIADADGRELVVDVSPGACTDGMSDIAYPASVEVSFEGTMSQGCGGRPESTFVGTDWRAERIGDVHALTDTPATLVFADDGSASGSTGCNRWSGGWRLTGESLVLERLATTRRACRGEMGEQERRLLAALEAVSGFELTDDGALVLTGASGPLLIARPE